MLREAHLQRLERAVAPHLRAGWTRAVFSAPQTGDDEREQVLAGPGAGVQPTPEQLAALFQAARAAANAGLIKQTYVLDDRRRVQVDARHGRPTVRTLDPETVRKVMGGKDRVLRPDGSSALLRTIGIMNADGTISAANARKYKQVNHLAELCRPTWERLVQLRGPAHPPSADPDSSCDHASSDPARDPASSDPSHDPASSDLARDPASSDPARDPASSDTSRDPASSDLARDPASSDTSRDPASSDPARSAALPTAGSAASISTPAEPRRPAGPRLLRVLDLACGNAYLSFVLAESLRLAGVPLRLHGVDVRDDVVARSRQRAAELGMPHLSFARATIAEAEASAPATLGGAPDIVLALHACDTATDEALALAIRLGAPAILSVPCCQHELAGQLAARPAGDPSALAPSPALLRHGLLRGAYADLLTDALRVELLEACGYDVAVVEFVGSEHTAKNILLRAHRRHTGARVDPARWRLAPIAARCAELGLDPDLLRRLLAARSAHPAA
ncbi:MAG: methyltransferase [Myxococcales bacterium]|nr:methyltransferase [Myxococcales bacterium]